MKIAIGLAVLVAALHVAAPARAQVSALQSAHIEGAKDAKISLVYQHEIPGVPGKSIKGVLVEYGPGGYSPSHRHARSAIIYATVIEGAVRIQVNGGPVNIYRAGENWTELPGDHHDVSANASDAKPAKILAVFVVDTNDAALTTPDHH